MSGPWPEQDIALLKRRWEEGATDSQIARELDGRYTRNAVIGQRHRAGCTGRQVAAKVRHALSQSKRTDHARPAPYAPPVVAADPGEECPIVEITMVESAPGDITIIDLKPHHCRWPTWTSAEKGGIYCGAKRLKGHPYCGPHCGVAYTAKTGPQRPWETWERRRK
jgi:GcrA cell cycle regulator